MGKGPYLQIETLSICIIGRLSRGRDGG